MDRDTMDRDQIFKDNLCTLTNTTTQALCEVEKFVDPKLLTELVKACKQYHSLIRIDFRIHSDKLYTQTYHDQHKKSIIKVAEKIKGLCKKVAMLTIHGEITWEKGDDYKAGDATFVTYGINKMGAFNGHFNAVEVYSSEADRDMILKLLQGAKNETSNDL